MKIKRKIGKRLASIILTLALLVSGITFFPSEAYAAGWLEYANRTITLGTAVNGSIKSGDYRGLTEATSNSSARDVYWHIYKFAMPKEGLLNLYIESASSQYLTYGTWRGLHEYDGFIIYPASDPDTIMWRSKCDQNEIKRQFSSSRAMYYGSTEIALNQGEYYFAIRQYETLDTPYYLTLSYKEPDINVTSISLSKKNIELEPGEQAALNASVLPENATDKTVKWESSSASVASVENGIITAKSPGTTTITASSADGEITASCLVTVIDAKAIDDFVEMRPTINSVSPSVKRATVYFSSVNSSDTKYQVAYKTGSGKWKIKNTSSLTTTIRKLQSRKSYAFRVRGYKKFYGKTYYTQWSSVKRATIR